MPGVWTHDSPGGWKPPLLWLSCAAVFALGAVGCNDKSTHKSAQHHVLEKPPWVVIVGAEGGFTGGGSGHRILSDGSVFSWSRLTPEHELTGERLGTAAPEHLAELQRALASESLTSLTFQKTANMTAFLELQQGLERRRFSWPERSTKVKLPAPLQACYEAALAAVKSVPVND